MELVFQKQDLISYFHPRKKVNRLRFRLQYHTRGGLKEGGRVSFYPSHLAIRNLKKTLFYNEGILFNLFTYSLLKTITIRNCFG